MTVHLDPTLVEGMKRIAADHGTNVDSLINEVIRDYLDMKNLPDFSADDVAVAQLAMLPELEEIPPYIESTEKTQ